MAKSGEIAGRVGFATAAFFSLGLFVYRALLVERQSVDDVFIYLRYARNLAHGDGFVFSSGWRVEGASSLVWTFLLAACRVVGADGLGAAKLLSLLCAVAAGALGFALVWFAEHDGRASASHSRWFAFAVPFAMALDCDFSLWAVSGMDSPIWIVSCVLAIALASRHRLRAAAVVLGCLAWVRPEGPFFAFVGLCGLFALKKVSFREAMTKLLLPCAAPLALLLAVRWFYFRDVLPNTFYAKMVSGDVRDYDGVGYVVSFFTRRPVLLLAFLGTFPFALRHAPRCENSGLLLTVALIVATIGFAGIARGDWMPNRRFLVPLVVLLPIAVGLSARHIWRQRYAPLAVCVVLFFEAGFTTRRALDQTWRTHESFLKTIGHLSIDTRPLVGPYPLDWMPTHLLQVIAPFVRAGDWVAHVDVGQLPYVLNDIGFLDGFGLVDREAAHSLFSPHDAKAQGVAVEAFFSRNPAAMITVLDERASPANVPFSPVHAAVLRDSRFAERYVERDRVPTWGDHPCVTYIRRDRIATPAIEGAARRWLKHVPDVKPAFTVN